MISIRRSAFETNSSSMHAMIISNDENYTPPTQPSLEFCPDSFGWEFRLLDTIERKAAYLYTSLILAFNEEEAQHIITEALNPLKIKCIFKAPREDSYGWIRMDIDHGPCDEFVDLVSHNESALRRYLFNPNSYVVTGNDNCDETQWHWWHELAQPENKEQYLIIEKDN